jgi:hypothetical protein
VADEPILLEDGVTPLFLEDGTELLLEGEAVVAAGLATASAVAWQPNIPGEFIDAPAGLATATATAFDPFITTTGKAVDAGLATATASVHTPGIIPAAPFENQGWVLGGRGAHPFNLEINGIDRIASVQFASIEIEMPGPGSNGSMSFVIADPTAAITVNEWDEVRFIEHAATRPILFGGFVQSVRYVAWAAVGRSIEVQCVGYGILLDKKAVPAFTAQVWQLTGRLVSLINQYGGRIWCTGRGTSYVPTGPDQLGPPSGMPNNWYSVAGYGNSWAMRINMGDPFTGPANSTLRGQVDHMMANCGWLGSDTPDQEPITGTYWVDGAAMFWAFPLVPDHARSADPLGWAAQFDGAVYNNPTVPNLVIDESGAVRVTRIEYEREDTDRTTSTYVVGGSAPGTGYYREPGLSRAGDLESIITNDLSTDAEGVISTGGGSVRQTTGATVRGEVEIAANSPIAAWPGRNIAITSTPLHLSSADYWRITSTTITFQSYTARTYSIGFGGSVPPPSQARRMGRFATRKKGSI